MLEQGYSSIHNVQAIMKTDPYAATWLTVDEERTPFVVLGANRHYWNPERGPRLQRVVFRNDLTPEDALHRCMTTEGQVDLVTNVPPAMASVVQASEHADLLPVNAQRVLTGVFNRFRSDVPFHDRSLRLAMNLAVHRAELIQEAFYRYAHPVPALTPPWSVDFPEGLDPRPYDPDQARQLLKKAGGWPAGRVLQIATFLEYELAARFVASHIQTALQIPVSVMVIPPGQKVKYKRILAEKKLIPDWDILLVDTFALFSEDTPAFFHREFFGWDGALRAGPELPEFDLLFSAMATEVDPQRRVEWAKKIDRFAYDEALALYLCCPQDLYAVNRHVIFRPYRTTLEFADTEVTEQHWSRRVLR
jgi:peptide/nickel transport system substrate-binding protein